MADKSEGAKEIIEIEIERLSNSMAGVMLVSGAVAGAFCLWAYFEYRRTTQAKAVGLAMVERGYEEPIQGEFIPQTRGNNAFNAFNQG